jgi:hypothetical protein
MSARDTVLPDRALLTLLNGFNRRLIAAERRLRFPGVVRYVGLDGPTGLTGSLAANNLITLTLEPGRWLLFGGNFIRGDTTPSDLWDFRLYMVSTSMPYPSVAAAWQGGFILDQARPLSLIHTVTLTASETITLQARVQSFNGSPMTSNKAYLLAVPG